MEITEADLEYGDLIKETEDNKCRINLTDIYTLDRKRLMDRKGKVNNAFMKKVMTRIASQLGITLDSGCNIEGIADKIYEMLLHFDKIFDKLDDEEKQQLIQALISKVEVYKKNEIKTTKTYIKEITYAFDVFNLDTNFLGNKSNNVETVCLLSRKDK